MNNLDNNLNKDNFYFFRRKPVLSIILAVFLLLFSIFFIKWAIYWFTFPKKIVYFQDSFSEGINNWTVLDGTWKAKDGYENGVIQLSKKQYAAPYIEKDLQLSQSPPESFVWQTRLKVSSFTGNALTLGTVAFPNGQITLVINKNNQLGVSYNLFDKPVYSQGPFSSLNRNKWYDIYVLVDGSKKKIIVYVGNKQVLTNPYISSTLPVQELWLGSIWLEGGGQYGAPLDVCYSTVNLENNGALPKLSFLPYTMNMIRTILSNISGFL